MFVFPHRSHEIEGSVNRALGDGETEDREDDGLDRPLRTPASLLPGTSEDKARADGSVGVELWEPPSGGEVIEVGESVDAGLVMRLAEPRSLLPAIHTSEMLCSDSVARRRAVDASDLNLPV